MKYARQQILTTQQLELYAMYVDIRAEHRPEKCNNISPCWVLDGPPSITTNPAVCVGCRSSPRLQWWDLK